MHRSSRITPAALLLLAAACAEQPAAVRSAVPPEPATTLARLTCTAEVRARTLACSDAGLGGARGDVVTVGGQNHYVRLSSTGTTYDAGTDVLSSSVNVQNLLAQPMAKTAGGADSAGVRVFFASAPTVTGGTGPVTVTNATGVGAFTAANQPYFQYGGSTGGELGADGVLSSGESSDYKSWHFAMNGATSFTFVVYVQARVPDASAAYLSLTKIVAGGSHTCGLTAQGRAYCWGLNNSGELGDSTTVPRFTPVAVHQPQGVTFASLVAGQHFTCGLTGAGQAYCWGYNAYGELGDSTITGHRTPAPVLQRNGLTFTAMAAGNDFACGIDPAGQAYCWGDNSSGQLGIDSTSISYKRYPAKVVQPGGVQFATIAGGRAHACAVSTTGGGYCWGSGGAGQVGDGQFSLQPKPVEVGVGIAFAAIAPGSFHTCGVTVGGAAYCWGDNSVGQLGDGSGNTHGTPNPVPQPGGVSFDAVTSGDDYSCARSTGGAVYCWGANGVGQIGNGTTASQQPTPVQAGASLGVTFTAVTARNTHTCAIAGTGPAYCWGENVNGEGGDGTIDPHSTPTLVAGTR